MLVEGGVEESDGKRQGGVGKREWAKKWEKKERVRKRARELDRGWSEKK